MSPTPFPESNPQSSLEGRSLQQDAIACALGQQSDDAFFDIVMVRHLHRGQMIFDGTGPDNVLVVVTSGLVKLISLLPDGRQQIVALLSGSDSYWQRVSASDRLHAEAASETDICLFSGKQFVDALGTHPAVRQTLLERSLSDLDHARAQLLVLGRMAACEKVASLLLELWSKSALQPPQRNSNLPEIVLLMTREDMADYLGLTLETVSRCLSQFKLQGIVRLIDARTIEICDPDLLSAIGRLKFKS